MRSARKRLSLVALLLALQLAGLGAAAGVLWVVRVKEVVTGTMLLSPNDAHEATLTTESTTARTIPVGAIAHVRSTSASTEASQLVCRVTGVDPGPRRTALHLTVLRGPQLAGSGSLPAAQGQPCPVTAWVRVHTALAVVLRDSLAERGHAPRPSQVPPAPTIDR